ncbi:Bor/Iss family lipoprotein [Aeromonas jandaei]|uniref:Bor/Iss family lipoprotein n=1 Tax=Aeromonas jandaei TaxID=650 RepID=UPI003EC58138
MINGKTRVVISLFALFICGCSSNIVRSDSAQTFSLNKGAIVSSKEITSYFFFSEIDFGMNDTIDAASICHGAENVVRIETKLGFWDSVLSSLSFGIYAPRTARVDCAV